LRIYSILLLIGIGVSGGCAVQNEPKLEPSPQPTAVPDAQTPPDAGFDEFSRRDSNGDFSKSYFVVTDFMSVVSRVPDFTPGITRFSSPLPRTRYGEILMEALRQSGFAIVLGDATDVPALRYSIELPSEESPDIHTFFINLGGLELKRSYEIFGERIAPVSDMLMAGIDPGSLRPIDEPVDAFNSAEESVGIERINELVTTNDDWDPLDVNLYETRESIYQPLFADSTRDYQDVSRQVLLFPNDSLVLGSANKNYLFSLAEQVKDSEDIIRLVGCSHGNTQLADGNEKLAKGRAIRVREELLLAGVPETAILHEACWANQHYDEEFPRRGVVVFHLRPTQ